MNFTLAKLARRFIRAHLERSSPQKLLKLADKKLIPAFQRAARLSLAYQTLLLEAGIQRQQVCTIADFIRLCPILEKTNTFGRFPIEQLLVKDLNLTKLASILTSSGHGHSGFALGLSTRYQYKSAPFLIDLGLDLAFNVDNKRTLLINCLPMGVTFQSQAVCVANVSVREDMVCAVVKQAGHLFEQIILCADPLFLKHLCDYSAASGIEWGHYKINVIIGEETFTESFRAYLATCLGINSAVDGGLIVSSMGVGELGLNLFNETRESIALRQACINDPKLSQALLSSMENAPVPTLLCYNPLHTFVEVINPTADGKGELVISSLDTGALVPLMRYKTGDQAKLIDLNYVTQLLVQSNSALKAPTLPLIALYGRSKDFLPGGWHVDHFKEALYSQPCMAREYSGAFRLSLTNQTLLWEVQLCSGSTADPLQHAAALSACLTTLGKDITPGVVCLNYEEFPYGKTLDYERKFVYFAS